MNHKGYLRVLRLALPYMFIVGLIQWIGFEVAGLDLLAGDRRSTLTEYLIVQLFAMFGTVLLLWVWNKVIDNCPDFKFHLDRAGLRLGVLLPIGILSVGFFGLIITEEITVSWTNVSFEQLMLGFVLFLLVSITEEMLMRYYVLRNLMLSFSPYIALILHALLFSAMHIPNPSFTWISFLNLFLAGVFLGTPYIFNRNLTFPIAGHLVWNFVQGPILGFEVSGADFAGVLELELTSNHLMNGGRFGFEGSLLCTVLLVFGTVIVWGIYKKRTGRNGS